MSKDAADKPTEHRPRRRITVAKVIAHYMAAMGWTTWEVVKRKGRYEVQVDMNDSSDRKESNG